MRRPNLRVGRENKEVASVTKNFIGAGVLSLSAGIALYSNDTDTSTALWSSTFMILKSPSNDGCSVVSRMLGSDHGRTESTLVAIVSFLLPAQGMCVSTS
jgi:hypothetical protein